MPAKNAVKIYLPGGNYHIYNRGVEKRKIFLEEADYEMFKFLVRRAIARSRKFDAAGSGGVDLMMQCLLPNHLHLLLRQGTERGMETFMRSAMNAYVAYFNKKYERVGPLFQGTYKAVLIKSDEQLLQVKKYIRENPAEAGLVSSSADYPHFWETGRETPATGVSLPGTLLE